MFISCGRYNDESESRKKEQNTMLYFIHSAHWLRHMTIRLIFLERADDQLESPQDAKRAGNLKLYSISHEK